MNSDGGLVSFVADAAEGTVRVTDGVESSDIQLGVDAGVDVTPAITDLFVFPVDAAVSVTTTRVRIDPSTKVLVRDSDGDHLGGLTSEPRRFEGGTYFLELAGSTKTYLRVRDAAFTARYESSALDTAAATVEFDDETTVTIGARSKHTRPEATIDVPDDPAAVAEAVSYLGSSVKEFTSERSWPTLRGHPPAIRPSDELDVPSQLSKPDTGVTIEVPAEYEYVYPVVPLAFYFGATLEIGDSPALHLDNGYSEPLETPERSPGEHVASVLSRALFFDSLVRIGGYYSFRRREYDLVAPELPFYPPNLHGEPLAVQLLEYLEVDPASVDGLRPAWPCTATLRPRVEDAALLSSLANELAPIRVASGDTSADPDWVTDPAIRELGAATTTDEVPPGWTRLVPEAFVAQRERQLPVPEDVTLGFVLGDSDRADALRSSLDAARKPQVRDATTVVADNATPDALGRVLDADPDFLYCEPGTDADGAVSDAEIEDAADSWPSVVMFGCSLSPSAQRRLCENGTLAGLTADGRLSPSSVVHLVAPLVASHTLPWSADLAGLDSPHQFFGSPVATLVRRADGMFATTTDVESVSRDEHVVHRSLPATETNPLGSVARVNTESVDDVYFLAGTSAPESSTYTTEDVVDALEDDTRTLRLNGTPYRGESEPTAEFVRKSARHELEHRQG
ncbi:hypothetical protein [Halobacterium rubrum]|uniref:hypothetical protein n=1 Tax=Halobacterium TaxID=2239 RepID=UPI001F46D12B|nr:MULTISPECIES: hypothetical protein [Halobacterium]MDH5019057.1 hypothetical protein [Halobacterium rubrum]